MELRVLVEHAVAERMAELEVDGDQYHITIGVSETEDEEGDFERTQLVSVYADDEDDDALVVIYAVVGAFLPEHDVKLAKILRGLSSSAFTRVYISEADDDGEENIIVEAAWTLDKLDTDLLGVIVQEVADIGDSMERDLFGTDVN